MHKHSQVQKNENASLRSAGNVSAETSAGNRAYLADNRGLNNPVQRKANNTGLPDNLKSGIENLSGHSLDDVKVHYNSSQPAQLNAHAYAQGNQIHLAPGQEKHLPHEAWHVVQQKQGRVKPTMQLQGKYINDNRGLENEADRMGAKAMWPGRAVAQFVSWKEQKQVLNTAGVIQRGKFNETYLNKTSSIRGHVMYARDQPITTKKARRRASREAFKKTGAARKGSKAKTGTTPRNRFFTHTEGHYVKTLSTKNLGKRVYVKGKIMEHRLQGRLDMCKNCQAHILSELKAKYPNHTHHVHYAFNDLSGSRTFWKGKGKKVTSRSGKHTLTRYNMSKEKV